MPLNSQETPFPHRTIRATLYCQPNNGGKLFIVKIPKKWVNTYLASITKVACVCVCGRIMSGLLDNKRLSGHNTLLYWILFISSAVCGRPGKRSLKLCKRVSALWAKKWFFSASATRPLTLPPQDERLDFMWFACFLWFFCFQTWTAASILFAISRVWCSDERSRQSSRHSGENRSAVM